MTQRSQPKKTRAPKAQPQLDAVFQAPLEEFVQARAAAVTALQKKGQDAAAAQAKKLKKPTASAWAVNQLFFREPESWAQLLEAGQGLRQAAESPPNAELRTALHDAQKALQRSIDTLREKARRLLAQGGRKVAESTLNRVAKTLRALAIIKPNAELRAGHLSTDIEPPGLEALSSVWSGAPPSEAPVSEPRSARQPSAKRKQAVPHKRTADPGEPRKKAQAAQKRADSLRKERERAAAQRKRAQSELTAQQRELDKRMRASEAAARKQEAARQALAAAEAATQKAERGVEAARAQVKSARAALKLAAARELGAERALRS